MRMRIQLRIIPDDDSMISENEILRFVKRCDLPETIGLSLAEARTVLAGAQESLVTAQMGTSWISAGL